MKTKNLLLLIVTFMSLNSFAQIPPYVPTSGLVGWWPFTGNANDSSGNGNNGTVNGPTLTADRFLNPNSAYHFNRSNNDYITVSQSASLNTSPAITISVWAYLLSTPSYNHFVNKTDQSSIHQYVFSTGSPGLYFYYDNSNFFQPPTLPSINQWHNLAVTYEYDGTPQGSKCKFYIDGLCTDSFVTTAILQTTTYDLRFGSYANNSVNTVDGDMDDIGIWSRALTQAEITALFVGPTVGINELNSQLQISVFPNPASSIFSIAINSQLINANAVIYNALGEKIFEKKITSPKTEINLSNHPNGIYFVAVRDEKNNFVVRKVVKI